MENEENQDKENPERQTQGIAEPPLTVAEAQITDFVIDPLQFQPAEPPSYEASTSQGGAQFPSYPPEGVQAPPLPQKTTLDGTQVSTIPIQQSYNGVITNDMMANFAGMGGTNSRKESTRKHQKVLKCTGIWQILASGLLFVLSIIKHVHGHRMYGLFGYASAAAGLLAGTAAIMTSHKPSKASIVATIVLGGLAMAGGVTGLVGNGLMWRCPYVTFHGWCWRGHKEARTSIGFSLFASSMELAFAFGQTLIASILLCRKESGRMSSTQVQGTAPVNFVLQVTPGPMAQDAQLPQTRETELRDCP